MLDKCQPKSINKPISMPINTDIIIKHFSFQTLMRKFSIAFLSFGIGRSGGEKVIVRLANGLTEKGHKAYIVAPKNAIGNYYNISAEVVACKSFRQVPYLELLTSRYILSNACPKTDIICATWCLTVPAALRAAQINGSETIYLAQHYEPLFFEGLKKPYIPYVKSSYKKIKNIVSVSSWITEQILKNGGNDSMVINPGIDHDIFYPRLGKMKRQMKGHSQKYKIDNQIDNQADNQADSHIHKPIICGFASESAWKGTQELIEGAKLARKEVDFQLVLIGRNGPEIPGWLGKKFAPTDDELAQLYSDSTALVVASWAEGFSAPPLEAGACSCPSIITDCGGPRDYAVDGKNCLLVPPRNYKAISDAIIKIIKNTELRHKLAGNSEKTAAEYTWKKMIGKFEKYCWNIL